MNCRDCQTLLNDHLDGELATADTARVVAHLAGCADCRRASETLRNLLRATAELPREIEPARDLWPALEVEIEQPSVAAASGRPTVGMRTNRDGKTAGAKASRSMMHWLMPLAAAAAIVALARLPAPRLSTVARNTATWTVERLAGAPRIGREAVRGETALRIGQWIETDANSRVKLASGAIGEVSLEPNSRLRLNAASTDHRLELARGTMSAFIWAPPRLFLVDTPAARAIDLGCAYTMSVADNGDGELHVTLGYVALEHGEREALIPAHARCLTRRGVGPGTPFADDAPAALRAALARFDFGPGHAAEALRDILAYARPDDAVTLWHLLARTPPAQRAGVFDLLARFHPPPAGVTRAGILAGDVAMRRAWGTALGLGTL